MGKRPAPVFKRDIRIPAETRPAFLIGAGIVAFVAWGAAWVLPVRAWMVGSVTTQVYQALPLLFEWITGCLIMAVAVWLLIRFVIFDGKPKKVGHSYPTKLFWVGLCVGLAVTGVRIAAKTAQDVTPQLVQAAGRLKHAVSEDLRQYDSDASAVFDVSELRPENLARDSNLERMRRNVREARDLLGQRRAADLQTRTRLLQAVRQTPLSAARESMLLDSYQRYSRLWNARAEDYWMLRGKALDQAGELIALLAAKRSAWRVEGGRLVFSDRDLMTRYRRGGEQMILLDRQARLLAQTMATASER